LNGAVALSVVDPFGAEANVAPFLSLREQHPDNLFVHEAYQDAVFRHGIEGHLHELDQQYQALELRHPGDPVYHYLRLRAMVGRSTPAAIRGLIEMVVQAPDFAPAHRTLAEIYGGASLYRNPDGEKTESAKFRSLCEGEALVPRPDPPSWKSPLFDGAENLLATGGDPDRIIAMTEQGLREEEWRSQRIRAFDWYEIDFKRQVREELRARYWLAWTIQVRCQRKAGRAEKAAQLLALMEERAAGFRNKTETAFWEALETLFRLHYENQDREKARHELSQMEQFLMARPDAGRAKRLEGLRRSILPIQ
jgi:hypothetical protein